MTGYDRICPKCSLNFLGSNFIYCPYDATPLDVKEPDKFYCSRCSGSAQLFTSQELDLHKVKVHGMYMREF